MKAIKVHYFASLRELLGKSDEAYLPDKSLTANLLWKTLNPNIKLPESSLLAINHAYAELDSIVCEGDEVAFFPPVTGG